VRAAHQSRTPLPERPVAGNCTGEKLKAKKDTAEMSAPGSFSFLFGALRVTMVTSLLTIVFGMVTNKVISVVTGNRGLGLIGLYRILGSTVSSVVPLGANDVITRRISTARDPAQKGEILGAALLIFLFQSVAILLVAVGLGGPISQLLFGNEGANAHVFEVRLVLLLTCGVIGFQLVTAVLNGFAQVKQTSLLGLVTASATLVTVYPFLRLGDKGLPLVISATCFVGAGLGLVYVRRSLGDTLLRLPRSYKAFREALPLSPWLALHPLVITGSTMGVQSILVRQYGLSQLGNFNAASLVEGTAVMILTSAMRSFYLPSLGKLNDQAEKRSLTDRMAMPLLAATFIGAAVVLIAAPLIIKILFSKSLASARELVMVMIAAVVGQIFVWFAAMFLLHKGDYKTLLTIDSAWAVCRVAGTAICAFCGLQIVFAGWVHVAAYSISAVIYGVVIARRYNGSLFGWRTVVVGASVLIACVAVLLLMGVPLSD
jgi:enterobacterial common antigen flippase